MWVKKQSGQDRIPTRNRKKRSFITAEDIVKHVKRREPVILEELDHFLEESLVIEQQDQEEPRGEDDSLYSTLLLI
jgi:hypothetical protein